MQQSQAMLANDVERRLDNPIWWCLATRHAHLARGGARARRYPPEISPLGGLADVAAASVDELDTITEVGDDFGTFARVVPAFSARWQTLREARIAQMIRADPSPLPEGGVDVVTLGACDVGEMLALVELTQPGPFRPRTIELGHFIGVREGGRLLAMAGERMWIGDRRELSGVCTHPAAQGRGLARALMGRVVNRMLRDGQTPFLHVYSHNARAIDLYRALGFEQRTEFPLLHARRIA